MKKHFRIFSFLLALILLIPSGLVKAQDYIRPNGFLGISGPERKNQIKKFQAVNNLNVDGIAGAQTNELLYNPNIGPIDKVENPASQGYWIVINKSKRILTVYNYDQVVGKYAVTLGSSKTPTPSTKAFIQTKEVNPAWGGIGGRYTPIAADDPRNPLGERWMGLKIQGTWGYGIHGTIKPWEIGTYSSNGCIRMFNYDIENFVFPLMSIGDSVWIGTNEELNSWGIYQYVGEVNQVSPELPHIKIQINGELVQTDTPPIIENDRTLVPIRVISENLGHQVNWNSASRTVEVLKIDQNSQQIEDVLIFEIDSDIVRKMNPSDYQGLSQEDKSSKDYLSIIDPLVEKTQIDVVARIVNDRTLVPLRFIGEEFGAQVDWDHETRTVIIDK